LDGGALVLDGEGFVVRSDSMWLPLPGRLEVVTTSGHRIYPSAGRRFFISVETFDAYHSVLETEDVPLPRLREAV
jgi:hypothetical protein